MNALMACLVRFERYRARRTLETKNTIPKDYLIFVLKLDRAPIKTRCTALVIEHPPTKI